MSKKTGVIILISFISVISFISAALLGGCANFSADATEPTATLVPLPAADEADRATTTPLPTATPIPPPSPTPANAVVLLTATTTPVSLPVVTPTASPQQAQPVAVEGEQGASPERETGLSGAWHFNFGTMTLEADGVGLTGTYHWYGGRDTGEITGTIIPETGQFSGLWISGRNPNEQGFLKWSTVRPDFVNGTFENNGVQGQWCGVPAGQPLPAGCGFSGSWQLHFGAGPASGQATLTQQGEQVAGRYTTDDGRRGELEGTITILSITEAILSGTWREAAGPSGTFQWQLDQTTNRTFAGRRDEGGSEWCGWRAEANRPDPCGAEPELIQN